MQANIWGFSQEAQLFNNGVYEEEPACKVRARDDDYWNFGANSSFRINTSSPYDVKTRFYADAEYDGQIVSIHTTITQGETQLELEFDCDELNQLSTILSYDMAMGVSVYDAGQTNDVACAEGESCGAACTGATVKIDNVVWRVGDSVWTEPEPEPQPEPQPDPQPEPQPDPQPDPTPDGEVVYGGAAPTLDHAECSEYAQCAECREAWWSTDPSMSWFECVDDETYRYLDACPETWDQSQCMTDSDQLCFISYPLGDADRIESLEAGCRTLPAAHNDWIDDHWEYSSEECGSYHGLCSLGCDNGSCHKSWPIGDPLRWESNLAMCRCMVQDD